MSTETASISDGVAANKVFAIPELFEMIILEVDERTVLLSQRVSKTYRDSIKSSIKLQRKLRLQPTPIESANKPECQIQLNPLLFSLSGPSNRCDCFFQQFNETGQVRYQDAPFIPMDLITDADRGPIVDRDGSWRRMLLVKTKGEIICSFRVTTGDGKSGSYQEVFSTRQFGDGVTAGILVDWIKEKSKAEYEWRQRLHRMYGVGLV